MARPKLEMSPLVNWSKRRSFNNLMTSLKRLGSPGRWRVRLSVLTFLLLLTYYNYYLLLQFVEALTTGKKSLSLDEPLTDEDCQFLRSIFVPAIKDRSTLSLPKNFDEEKIQGYAIVLKIISGKIRPVCSIEYIFSVSFFLYKYFPFKIYHFAILVKSDWDRCYPTPDLWPRWITTSEICMIHHVIRKPNLIFFCFLFQNIF